MKRLRWHEIVVGFAIIAMWVAGVFEWVKGWVAWAMEVVR